MAFQRIVLGLAAGVASVSTATDYNYTGAGVSGVWTDEANWHRPSGYPGDTTGQIDAALVNQPMADSYTVNLTQPLPGAIGWLRVGNPSGGTATVVVSTPLAINNNTSVEVNGRLVMDGVAVTGGGIGFGTNSMFVLNNGGSRIVPGGMHYVGGANIAAVTGLVTCTQAPAGMMDFQNANLRIGTTAGLGDNYLRIDNGVVATNINLQIGHTGEDNTVEVNGATVYATRGFNISDGGGCGGLFLLDNGAKAVSASNGAISTGVGSSYNRVVVTNGAHLVTYSVGYFGRSGTNNSVTVTGEGSVWDMGNNSMRFGGHQNGMSSGVELRIDNGGVVTNANGLQMVEDIGPAHNSRLIINNGKLYGTGLDIAANGRECLVDIAGKDALVRGTDTGNVIQFARCARAAWYFSGCSNNLMRVTEGTITNYAIYVASAAANMVSNRFEATDGARVFVPIPLNGGRFSVCDVGSNSWGNAAVFTGGSLLETKEICVNRAPTGDVWGNFISFEDSVLQFTTHNPGVTTNADGRITLKNSTVSFRGVTTANGIDIPSLWNNANLARLTLEGDTAFRLADSANRSDANQSYTFEKGLGARQFYRLEMTDGITHYRTRNATDQLTIDATGEMFCSNTTATVSIQCEVNGSLTVLDSTVLFERGLVLNGELVVDTDAMPEGRNVITVDGDLNLGAASRLVISGNAQEDVTIRYTGNLTGGFLTKASVDSSYSVAYGSGNDSQITLRYAPPGTRLIVR